MKASVATITLSGARADPCRRTLSTIDFAAIGDHARLPWRFFARLFAAAGSLIRPA